MRSRSRFSLAATLTSLLAALALPASALAPTAFSVFRQDAPTQKLEAAMEVAEQFFQVGSPARIRVRLANKGDEAVAVAGSVLFGVGLTLVLEDESRLQVQTPESPGEFSVPPHAEVAVTLDLARLLPKGFEKPGYVEVQFTHDLAEPTFVEIEVWKNYSGSHAILETEFGEIELEFFPDQAPITVHNYLSLVESGFYDGLTFHRIMKGFMVQGGCPRGTGTGGSGKNIPLEISDLLHTRGTISMARGDHPDSASSQFFICHKDVPALDGGYAAFGRVVKGYEVLDQLADVPCIQSPDGELSRPKDRTFIKRIRIAKGEE